jgi:1,2-diacylglycerol 3-alpha-glucosyltransferase
MRVALISTGLGRVLRGFESFTSSLFSALRTQAPDLDVVLFQGGGQPGERRVVVPNCHRYDAPARWFGYEKGNLLEKRTFALALYPLLRRGGFDIVHYNEIVMGSALFHLRRLLGGHYKLLYCNGSIALPVHYAHRCDFAQMLTLPAREESVRLGMNPDRLFLLPYGLNPQRFSPESRRFRMETRRKLRIPKNANVVLTVAALNRGDKRLDYLIKEVAALDESFWLLAAGQRTADTQSLEEQAEHMIPGRWRFVSWPQEDVPLLYGASDLFVLASLAEGFGLVTVEAMLSGLPAIIHNGPIFQWIAESSRVQTVDMSLDGALRAAIPKALSGIDRVNSREIAKERFSWDSLVPDYLRMYQAVANCRAGCGLRQNGFVVPA